MHIVHSVYDETKLRHVWRIGPIPCAQPPTGAQLSYLNCLGDTAVDFDIAPPRVVTTSTDNGKDVSFSLINVCICYVLYVSVCI